MTTYFDRYGVPLEVGQRVRVQHCVGRYGQTRIVTGILRKIGQYGNVYVTTEPPSDEGRCMYPKFERDPNLGEDAMRGYHEHRDFEHGHETWIEVIE